MEIEEIKQLEVETKKLLDQFSSALSSVKLTEDEEWNVEREFDRRAEGEGLGCNPEFRTLMFANAINKNEDFIMAEKKKW